MQNISLELDAVDGTELVGNTDTGFGFVDVTLVTEHGPAGGNPVIRVSGPAPSVLAWLLNAYTDGDYDAAIQTMELHGTEGDAHVGLAKLND